jgi:lysophospholipid acyltransferase (LPLAT)-like uncharacterized protein
MFKELKYFLLLRIFPPLIAFILVCLKSTLHIVRVNSEPVRQGWEKGENFIFCFWHGRLLMMPFAYGRRESKVLISRHRDGEFIKRIVSFFHIGAVRGSFRKGSVSSIREMLGDLKRGINIAITPDGPKGPRYVVKEGIIELARITGKSIIPITYGAGKKKLFLPGTALSSPTLFPRYSSFTETPST